jgi:hypothetical protein
MWPILWELYAPGIQWLTRAEWNHMRNTWTNMPGVLGAIDGTSHEVEQPTKEPEQELYSGHRMYHCIHKQVERVNYTFTTLYTWECVCMCVRACVCVYARARLFNSSLYNPILKLNHD